MKFDMRWICQWLVAACVSISLVNAAEPAVVNADNVNVRGQPAIHSEVVTQLQKDEVVDVLEELEIEDPAPGEPKKWSRIRMPEDTPVWVYAPYVDPSSMSVTVNLLNMRTGPGENFSIAGRVDRGATVQQIKKQGDWLAIAAPTNAYAFVASSLLDKSVSGASAQIEAATNTPQVVTPMPVPETDMASSSDAGSINAPPPVDVPIDEPETAAETEAFEGALTAVETPVPDELAPAETSAPEVVPEGPEDVDGAGLSPIPPTDPAVQTRRIVRREGIVRSAMSIQAPSFFELISPDTRRTINYLYNPNPEISLRDYRGHRVIVMGEEGLDRRWPNTPVIEVEKIELGR